MNEDPIRLDERVQEVEQRIRASASWHTDPFDFMFSEPGRLLFAQLGATRIRVALEQSKVNRVLPDE